MSCYARGAQSPVLHFVFAVCVALVSCGDTPNEEGINQTCIELLQVEHEALA